MWKDVIRDGGILTIQRQLLNVFHPLFLYNLSSPAKKVYLMISTTTPGSAQLYKFSAAARSSMMQP